MLPLLFFSFFASKRKQGVNCWVSADKQISLLTKTQQSHWYFGCTWDGNEGFLVLFDVVITTERSTEERSVGATWSVKSNNDAITLWGSCTGRSSLRPVALPSWFFFVPFAPAVLIENKASWARAVRHLIYLFPLVMERPCLYNVDDALAQNSSADDSGLFGSCNRVWSLLPLFFLYVPAILLVDLSRRDWEL